MKENKKAMEDLTYWNVYTKYFGVTLKSFIHRESVLFEFPNGEYLRLTNYQVKHIIKKFIEDE